MKRNATAAAATPAPAAAPPKPAGLFALGQLLRQCQQNLNGDWSAVAVLSEVCKPLHTQARTRVLKLLGTREPLPPGPVALLRRAQKEALSPIAPAVDVPLQNWEEVTMLGPGAVALKMSFTGTDEDLGALSSCPALQVRGAAGTSPLLPPLLPSLLPPPPTTRPPPRHSISRGAASSPTWGSGRRWSTVSACGS